MAASPLLPPQQISLYVGDLDPEVTIKDLNAVFFSVGPVSSIRLCRCSQTGKSLCYGYVNFFTHYQACRALETLNHKYLKGKPMRLMWSQRNPCVRKSGVGNLFVKNLDASIDSAHLQKIFSKFGMILSCKVAEEHGKSKGFGFVQFDSEDSALAARTALHDTMLEGKKLYVSKFVKKSERTEATPSKEQNYVDLFVKNLDLNMTEDALHNMFSAFGKVSNVVIMKHKDGNSRGFGFVNFESAEDAKKAVTALNGSQQGSQTLYVGKAQKKAKRRQFSHHEYRDPFNNHTIMLSASNLYVKNLESFIDENILREIFSPWGKIVSAKVMRHNDGTSKGFGFVCFSSPEEAISAMRNLNGSIYGRKYLYVAIAQCKKDRQLELQKYFAQSQSQSVQPSYFDVIPPPNSPLFPHFSPCPVPFFNPIPYKSCGVNMGPQYLPPAQSYNGYFSCILKHGKANIQDRDLSQGCAGMQSIVLKKQRYKISGPAGNIMRRLPPASFLAAANSNPLRHQPLVQNLQPEHRGSNNGMVLEMSKSDLGLQADRSVQVVTEDNSLRSASTGESA